MDFAKNSLEISRVNSQEKLEERAQYTSDFIIHTVDEAVRTIKNLARIYSVLSDTDAKQAAKINDEVMKDTDFQRIGFTDLSGKSYAGNGVYLDLSQREYFKDAMEGKSGVTNIIRSLSGEDDLVIVYEPIRHEGKINGMVHGVYKIKEISEALEIESLGDKGYFVVFQQDGKIIINTSKEKSMLYDNGDLWAVLQNTNYEKGSSYLNLRQNVRDGSSGFIRYSDKDETRLAYYTPVGVNDWYILQVLSQDVVASHSKQVNYLATLLVIKIIGALLILGIYVIKKEHSYQNIILNANRDVKTLTDAIPGGVQKCTFDEKCEFVYVSQGFINMTGYSHEEIRSRFDNRFINTVYHEDVDRVQKQLATYKGEEAVEFEYRIERRDGEIIWVTDRCNIVKDENNKLYYYCVVIDITKAKKVQREQQIINEKFKIAMGHLSCTVFEYDPKNDIIYNGEDIAKKYNIASVTKCKPKEIVELNIVDKDYADVYINMFKSICCGQNAANCVLIAHNGEESYWYKVTLTAVLDEEANPIWAIGTVEDITKLKEIEQRFAKEEQYRELYMADAVLIHEVNVTHDQVKVRSGSRNHRVTPAVSYSNICKKLINKYVYPDERESVANMFSSKRLIQVFENENGERECEIRCKGRDGKEFWVLAISHMLKDPQTSDILCFTYMRNIQNRKEKELKLKESAEMDVLTNLYNRAVAKQLIATSLNQFGKGEIHAFFIIDIDYFKHINDKFGHMQGDNIIISVADILKNIFRKGDIVARLGGDEFVIFMKNAGSVRLIEEKAKMLCKAVSRLKILEDREYKITVSVGVAVTPKDGTTYEELYKASDMALYTVKKGGRNGFKIF
ncbi:MAG: diguanylate cyclase [Anaerotignaceae bacterium]